MIIRELTQEEADEKVYPLITGAFADTFTYSVFDVRTELELQQFSRFKKSS